MSLTLKSFNLTDSILAYSNPNEIVECDSCPWTGFRYELDVITLENGDLANCCPVCCDLSISYMGCD